METYMKKYSATAIPSKWVEEYFENNRTDQSSLMQVLIKHGIPSALTALYDDLKWDGPIHKEVPNTNIKYPRLRVIFEWDFENESK